MMIKLTISEINKSKCIKQNSTKMIPYYSFVNNKTQKL